MKKKYYKIIAVVAAVGHFAVPVGQTARAWFEKIALPQIFQIPNAPFRVPNVDFQFRFFERWSCVAVAVISEGLKEDKKH